MHQAPFNTLAYQKMRPMTVSRDARQVSMGHVSKAFESCNLDSGKKHPEVEALYFYYLNHAMAEVFKRYHVDQPLPDGIFQIVKWYNDLLCEKSARMFYYVLIICIRESRHLNNKSSLKGQIVSTWGEKSYNFLSSIPDSGETAAKAWVKNPPDISLGDCVNTLLHAFNYGSWSSGYGGTAWGNVCAALKAFVDGKYTPEIFMDTAFTLAHNNGPIFNKGMLYTGYDSYEFIKILDCQRAGMVPNLINDWVNDNITHPYVPPALVYVVNHVKEYLKGNFLGYVDWFAVEDLGSVKNYPSEKKKQISLYGEPKTAPNKTPKAAPKVTAPEPKPEDEEFYVIPKIGKYKKVARAYL